MIRKVILLLVFIVTLLGCSSDKYSPVIEEQDGIKTVINKNYPKTDLEYETVFEIKEDEQKYVLSNISDFAEDKEGNLYFLDNGECHIKKFDKSGNFIKAISSKGAGPEEIGSAGEVIVTNDNRLITFDLQKMAFLIFDTDGIFLESKKADNFFPMGFSVTNDDIIYSVGIVAGLKDSPKTIKLVMQYDSNLNYVNTFVEANSSTNPMQSYLENMLDISYRNNKLYLNYVGKDKIVVYNDTIPEMKIIRETFTESVSEFSQNGGNTSIRLQPNSSGIAVDSKGNIYSITSDLSSENEVTYLIRFNSEGVQTGCFTTPDFSIHSYGFTNDNCMIFYDERNTRILKIKIKN